VVTTDAKLSLVEFLLAADDVSVCAQHGLEWLCTHVGVQRALCATAAVNPRRYWGVAALGISNASLAAVRERRREIGVLKALGATDRDVRRVFLIESGALGLLGGVLGAVLGYVAAVVVATIVNRYLAEQGYGTVPVEVPVVTMLAVTAGATVLAVVAGILPAAKAARLPAREAMGSV